MCMWFWCNPWINFCHFFHFLNFVIFWLQILWKCRDSGYLVSTTPHTILYRSLWNFAHVFAMVWRCACGLDIILKLFGYNPWINFCHFFHFVNFVIFWPQILWKCIDNGYLVSTTLIQFHAYLYATLHIFFSMVWRCACGLDLILQLIFVTFLLCELCNFSQVRHQLYRSSIYFLLWKQLIQIVDQTWLSLVTLTCESWSEGQHDLYFTVQWFCLISWRLFHVCTSYFGIMNQYDQMFDLKINVGHYDLYFMVQWFCLESWRLFDVWTSLFGIINQYDPTFDLKIIVGHCDLHFMLKWFCLISWRLIDVWTSLFGIMSQYDPKFDLKINIGHCDLRFMSSDFVLYLEDYLMYWHHTLELWPDVWPQNKLGLSDLYFMVQWFCLISLRLFDAWVSYFQIIRQCDPYFDLKVNVSQHDLYFMV